jgi:hypothetical protein
LFFSFLNRSNSKHESNRIECSKKKTNQNSYATNLKNLGKHRLLGL